ncbi:hypothetical protein Tco_0183894 [Tanacetum coccineum]
MATIRTCNKHNMIACVEKTAQNADFYQIIDYLTGCSINYSLLVDPDLIRTMASTFWLPASLRIAFLSKLFGTCSEILATRSKSTAWRQFGTNIASALVGLATNQKFNFSLMIMNGMLGHISNGTPFLMYPRFIQLFLNKQLEGVARPQDFIPSVTLPSKIFTFMRKHSPKFSCKITPLTPHMLEVVTALAAEEAHSTSPHSRDARDALRKSALMKAKSEKKQKKNTSSVKWRGIKKKKEKVMNLKKINVEEKRLQCPSSPIRPTQNIEPEEQFKVDEVLVDISRPRGLSIPGPIQSQPQPQQPSQATDPKDKGKGILVEEPKKKKLTLQQIRALETTNDEEVAKKIQAEWDAEEERKRFEKLKKAKPKTTLRKSTTLAQERNQMMNFLKGQGYKNLQKLKYPQMKELYDKVQESIQDSFKDFIPMDSEREKQILKERNEKRILRKRKATIFEQAVLCSKYC